MKAYIAEVFGTFLLVFLGTASVVTGGFGAALPLGQEAIGLAFGIGVICAAYAVGPISGAHLNPAVTIGVFLAGRMPAGQVVGYIVAQIIGGILAPLVLMIIVSGKVAGHTGGVGANGWDPAAWSMMGAFLIELVATFVFVMVILGVTAGKHTTAFAGLVIGLTLAAIHFAVIPVTGTSVNPARSIGPALFSGGAAIAQLWLFIVAPIIGGALAGIAFKTGLFEKD